MKKPRLLTKIPRNPDHTKKNPDLVEKKPSCGNTGNIDVRKWERQSQGNAVINDNNNEVR